MPTETKNVALKRICSGRISPSACWLKRLSLTTSPARKAPSDRLTPARLVRNAVPKQIAMTVEQEELGRAGARHLLEHGRHEAARDRAGRRR